MQCSARRSRTRGFSPTKTTGRNSIRSMLISDVATRLHSCRRFSADWFCSVRHRLEGVAVAIYLLEHHEPGKRLTRCLFPPHRTDSFMKLLDAVNGCDRSLLKFYKTRVPCNCLGEVYELYRRKSKTGICQGCGIRKKRRDLLICTRSKDVSGWFAMVMYLHVPLIAKWKASAAEKDCPTRT